MDDGTHYGPEGSVDVGDVACWCFVVRLGIVRLLDVRWWLWR